MKLSFFKKYWHASSVKKGIFNKTHIFLIISINNKLEQLMNLKDTQHIQH
jgi:hypothetical protein